MVGKGRGSFVRMETMPVNVISSGGGPWMKPLTRRDGG